MSLVCSKCGYENKNDAVFCSNCGESLDKEKDFKRYDGIGGWLILFAIGIILTPLRFLANIGEVKDVKTNEYILQQMPEVISFANNEIGFLYLFFVISLYIAYLFFAKKSTFPKVFIFWLIANFIFIIVDANAWTSFFPDEPSIKSEVMRSVFGGVVQMAIWIPYLIMSKRVKGTFIK